MALADIGGLFSGAPAPPPVERALLDGSPRPGGLSSRIVADKARELMRTHTAKGDLVLWIAPTSDGNICLALQHPGEQRLSPACVRPDQAPGRIEYAVDAPFRAPRAAWRSIARQRVTAAGRLRGSGPSPFERTARRRSRWQEPRGFRSASARGQESSPLDRAEHLRRSLPVACDGEDQDRVRDLPGDRFSGVRFRFADGHVVILRPREGWVLYALPPFTMLRAHRPLSMDLLRADGNVLQHQSYEAAYSQTFGVFLLGRHGPRMRRWVMEWSKTHGW